MIRLLLGLPFAALVTGALFALMYGFVRPGEVDLPPGEPAPKISIFAKITETPTTLPEAPIERVTDAPPPPAYTPPRPAPGERIVVAAPVPGELALKPTEFPATSPTLPIATVPPQYPARCQSAGTEGYAVVRYDVTANGQVVNARVVDRSHACFEHAALQAIRSWRYQPVVGGDGLAARGVTKRFSFDLNEA